eukprot:200027_1
MEVEMQEQEQKQDIEDDELEEQNPSHIKSYASKPYVSDNEVECTGFFDDYLYRQTAWSGVLFFFCLLAIGRMFADPIDREKCGDEKSISIGFTLCGIGLIIILIGSLIALILSILKRRIGFSIILFIILLIGGLIYIIGSWIITSEVPYIYCIVGASDSLFGGYGCIFFGEMFLIGSLSIIFGLDLWKDKYLNDFKLRMLLFCSFIAFSALITFFGYAIIGNYLYKENLSEYAYIAQDYIFTGCGWFFIFITMVIYLVVLLLIKKTIIYVICSCVLILSTLLCSIGYWALNQRGKDSDNAYYIGMSFFVLFVSVMLSIDMSFGKYIKQLLNK